MTVNRFLRKPRSSTFRTQQGPAQRQTSSIPSYATPPPAPFLPRMDLDPDNGTRAVAQPAWCLALARQGRFHAGSQDSEGAIKQHRRLASILRALGDNHYPHVIYTALWQAEKLPAYIVDCIRTAQTQPQAEACREMLDSVEAEAPTAERRDSWTIAVWDLLLAQTYNWGLDVGDALAQYVDIVTEIVDNDQGQARLRSLDSRGLPLDVLAYTLFASALARYNQAFDPERGQREIDVQEVLGQFIDNQPAFRCNDPLQLIDCLPSCLGWCREMLGGGLAIPAAIRIIYTDSSPVTEACTLLCSLWYSWLGPDQPCPSPSTSHQPTPTAPNSHDRSNSITPRNPLSWADTAETQLGISGTELLSTLVWMIIAAAPSPSNQNPDDGDEGASISTNGASILTAKWLAGVDALLALAPEDLIWYFLEQERATDQGPIEQTAAAIEPLRQFVAQCLDINLPPTIEQKGDGECSIGCNGIVSERGGLTSKAEATGE